MTKLYIFWSPSYPFRIKIGISQKPSERAKQLKRVLNAKCRVIFCVPMFGAVSVEKTLHALFFWANMPIRGNGGTEWFSIFIFPFAFLLILAAFVAQIVAVVANIALLIYLFFWL